MASIKKPKPMTDREIVSAIEQLVSGSVGYQDSRLAQERQEVQEYYQSKRPYPAHKGNSKYVSTDVYDSVESMKATLLETFAAGSGIGQFVPSGAQDVEKARLATAYVDDVVFNQNDGYEVFSDVIQDGLTNRVGIAQVWWNEEIEETEEEFEAVTEPELMALLEDDQVELQELTWDEASGLFDGIITRYEDRSQVKIEAVPPEHFGITESARTIKEAACVWRRHRKTYSELLEEGYSKRLLDQIPDDATDGWEIPETMVRLDSFSSGRSGSDEAFQQQLRSIWVYETYVNIDIEGTGIAKLWKITKAGNVILHKERVSRKPFVAFIPLRIPHSFYGTNFAAKVIPTQNAKTVLTRGILDHTVVTNNPRYKIVKGSVTNPKELMDSRVGGIVNVTRPDGVLPFEQPSLNPFVFQTIQLLDYDLEDTTGISRLSQGLNKDAISKQNSAALVEQLTDMGMIRQKVIARNFANGFLKPLYKLVYELVAENESRERMLPYAGEWVTITPDIWMDSRDYRVDPRLGYGEKDREAAQWMEFNAQLTQDPTAAPLYPVEKKFNVLRRVLELKGVKDVENYLVLPEQIPPPEPDPILMKQMEMQERELALRERAQALAEQKLQMEMQERMAKLRLQEETKLAELDLKERDQDLEERAQEHKEYVDRAEVELLRQADPDDQRHIVSPSG